MPFSGVLVVERSQGVGAAYCGKLLAELGAEVVKLEPPGGDRLRHRPPLLPAPAGYGVLYLHCNQRKRSVVLDDTPAEGRERLHRLLDGADVLLTDAPPAELARLGLGEAVERRWPALVHASIRGYGLTGPLAEAPSSELDTFHAGGEGRLLPGGLGYKLFPDRPPVKAGRHLAGYDSGLAAAALVAAALFRRQAGGGGELIDVSEQEVEISLNRMNLDAQLNAGMDLTRAHRGYDFGGIFPCLDGYVTVRPNEDRHWAGLALGMGREDLVEDPRFATRRGRQDNAEDLNVVLSGFFASRTMLEIYAALGSRGTPVGYFADAKRIHESEQFVARHFFVGCDVHGSKLAMPGPAYRMTDTPPLPPGPAPLLGADTEAILGAAPRAAKGASQPGARGCGLLSGLRIVDTSWAAAGPYVTEVAALLGAQVIKVETGLRPDLFRRLVDGGGQGLDASSRFNALNMRKLGLRLNLTCPAGREAFLQLIAVSDAFVENFRPGVVDRLGIAYADLQRTRPDLVMLSISAAGRGGPHQDHPGYASIFNAMGGLGHLTGYGDGPPTEVRDSVDLRVAAVGSFALLAALFHRARTGRGQWIDVSAREAIASLTGDALLEYALSGVSPARDGNRDGEAAPYGVFRCRGNDAWVAIAVTDDDRWRGLCAAMGLPHLAGRYPTGPERARNRREIEALVESWTLDHLPAEAAARCRAAGVPASPVVSGRDMLTDPHLEARDVLQTVRHPRLGEQTVVRAPWRLRSPEPALRPSPLLGEHNAAVLVGLLGYGPDDLARMEADGAFD